MRIIYRPGLGSRRPLWFMFLFLTVIFFFNSHDISSAKVKIDEYNQPIDQFLTQANEGSLPHQISSLLLAAFAVVSLALNRNRAPLRILGQLGWILLAFVAWAFLSSIWADNLSLTLRRLLTFGILCMASLAVARRFSLREVVIWTCFATSAFVLVGIVAEVMFGTFHPFASGYRFAGTLHPNNEGIECGLLVMSAVAAGHMTKRHRVLFGTCALLGLGFLILTGSRTALGSTLLGLVVYLAAVWSRSTKVVAACGLGIACSFLLLVFGAGLTPGAKSAVLMGRDEPGSVDSFSGRTLLWTAVGHYIGQRPILGYGYGGFWDPYHLKVISEQMDWAVPDAHSTYLDCLLALGAVGLTAYVLLISGGLKRAFRFHRISGNPAYVFLGAILAFSALDGFSESAALEGGLLTFLCMVALVRLAFLPTHQIQRANSETLPTCDRVPVPMAL